MGIVYSVIKCIDNLIRMYLICMYIGTETRDYTMSKSRDSICEEKGENFNEHHCVQYEDDPSLPVFICIQKIVRVAVDIGERACSFCFFLVQSVQTLGGAHGCFFINIRDDCRGVLRVIGPTQIVQRQIMLGEHYRLPNDHHYAVARLGRGVMKYAPYNPTSDFLEDISQPDDHCIISDVKVNKKRKRTCKSSLNNYVKQRKLSSCNGEVAIAELPVHLLRKDKKKSRSRNKPIIVKLNVASTSPLPRAISHDREDSLRDNDAHTMDISSDVEMEVNLDQHCKSNIESDSSTSLPVAVEKVETFVNTPEKRQSMDSLLNEMQEFVARCSNVNVNVNQTPELEVPATFLSQGLAQDNERTCTPSLSSETNESIFGLDSMGSPYDEITHSRAEPSWVVHCLDNEFPILPSSTTSFSGSSSAISDTQSQNSNTQSQVALNPRIKRLQLRITDAKTALPCIAWNNNSCGLDTVIHTLSSTFCLFSKPFDKFLRPRIHDNFFMYGTSLEMLYYCYPLAYGSCKMKSSSPAMAHYVIPTMTDARDSILGKSFSTSIGKFMGIPEILKEIIQSKTDSNSSTRKARSISTASLKWLRERIAPFSYRTRTMECPTCKFGTYEDSSEMMIHTINTEREGFCFLRELNSNGPTLGFDHTILHKLLFGRIEYTRICQRKNCPSYVLGTIDLNTQESSLNCKQVQFTSGPSAIRFAEEVNSLRDYFFVTIDRSRIIKVADKIVYPSTIKFKLESGEFSEWLMWGMIFYDDCGKHFTSMYLYDSNINVEDDLASFGFHYYNGYKYGKVMRIFNYDPNVPYFWPTADLVMYVNVSNRHQLSPKVLNYLKKITKLKCEDNKNDYSAG